MPGDFEILHWADLTGRQIDAIDRSRAVVLLSCSPLEVHGPHLPTITDAHESEKLAEHSARRLAEQHPEIIFLQLPTLYVATDVLPQVGSVRFRASTIVDVLGDLGRSVVKQGFRRIWVSNFHGGPRHFVAIERACERVNRRFGGEMISVFSMMISRLSGGNTDISDALGALAGMSPDELRGDSHGGAIETSLMLYLLGARVDAGYRDLARETVQRWVSGEHPGPPEPLPSNPLRLFEVFRQRMKYYEENTYAGAPAMASAEAGEQILARLSEMTAEALGEVWRGERSPAQCHSPLWPLPQRLLFSSESLLWLLEKLIRYRTQVF
ncbi:MAG: creatininase family protein [Myxococcales bacterium]|nr:creatininase family protein [Myxococcales bacterium]